MILELGLENGGLRELFIDQLENVWICSDFGIILLRKLDKDFQNITPAVSIRKIEINNSELVEPVNSPVSLKSVPIKLSLFFSCPGFLNQDLEFSYRYDDQNSEWSEWSSSGFVEFENLRGGSSQFELRSRLIGGEESEPKLISFFMPLEWYRDPYYFSGSLLFGSKN